MSLRFLSVIPKKKKTRRKGKLIKKIHFMFRFEINLLSFRLLFRYIFSLNKKIAKLYYCVVTEERVGIMYRFNKYVGENMEIDFLSIARKME